jgi:hypothetical protein
VSEAGERCTDAGNVSSHGLSAYVFSGTVSPISIFWVGLPRVIHCGRGTGAKRSVVLVLTRHCMVWFKRHLCHRPDKEGIVSRESP